MPPVTEERLLAIAQEVEALAGTMNETKERREAETRQGELPWTDPRMVALYEQAVQALRQASWRQQVESAAICRRFLSRLAALDAEEAKRVGPIDPDRSRS